MAVRIHRYFAMMQEIKTPGLVLIQSPTGHTILSKFLNLRHH